MEPDLDLTGLIPALDDRDPQTIIDDALDYVQTLLPGYRPVNGSLDVVLLEAMALAVADAIYAANRVPGAVLAGLLSLNGIPRNAGQYTAGTIVVTLDGNRDVTVTAGHRFAVNGVEYRAVSDVTITAASTITVPVLAADVGTEGNATPPNTEADLLDPIPWAVAAATTGVFAGGSDLEDDSALLTRAAARLPLTNSSLVLPSSFASWVALEMPDVARATAVDLFDGTGSPGSDLGHITVFVHGYGASLSAGRLAEIESVLDARASSHLTVHVLPAVIVTIPVQLSVRLQPGVHAEGVLDAIEVAVADAVSPLQWTWSDEVTPQEIAAIVARVPGVDYVIDVTSPAAPVTLPPGGLPKASSVVVTAA